MIWGGPANNKRFVYLDSKNGDVIYSNSDASIWRSDKTILAADSSVVYLKSICWDDKSQRFWATTTAAVNRVYYSPDGIQWTAVDFSQLNYAASPLDIIVSDNNGTMVASKVYISKSVVKIICDASGNVSVTNPLQTTGTDALWNCTYDSTINQFIFIDFTNRTKLILFNAANDSYTYVSPPTATDQYTYNYNNPGAIISDGKNVVFLQNGPAPTTRYSVYLMKADIANGTVNQLTKLPVSDPAAFTLGKYYSAACKPGGPYVFGSGYPPAGVLVVDKVNSGTADVRFVDTFKDMTGSVTNMVGPSLVQAGSIGQFSAIAKSNRMGFINDSLAWSVYTDTTAQNQYIFSQPNPADITVDETGKVTVGANAVPGNYLLKAASKACPSVFATLKFSVSNTTSLSNQASAAVWTAEWSFRKMDYDQAVNAVAKLADGTEKTNLKARLDKIYSRFKTRFGSIFPTGLLNLLPEQAINSALTPEELTIVPARDATERMAKFNARNSTENIARLCSDFYSTIIPGTPGLEQFNSLYLQGKYQEALEAYRTYFFDKLKNPTKYGSCDENVMNFLRKSEGKASVIKRPSEYALNQNLNNNAVAQINYSVGLGDDTNHLLIGKVGEPGAVPWVPFGVNPPNNVDYGCYTWLGANSNPNFQLVSNYLKTTEGRKNWIQIEFFRALRQLPREDAYFYQGGFFPALLYSYLTSSNKSHLERWCQYMDDFTMNARRDEEALPVNIRNALDFESNYQQEILGMLRVVLDENSSLAQDFNAMTLARMLMMYNTDFAPYNIRARRTEMSNWGLFGLGDLYNYTQFMPEFKSSEYFKREGWRLFRSNGIQHRDLDGENVETYDEAHNVIDIGVYGYTMPYTTLPKDRTEMEKQELMDHLRANERNLLQHIDTTGMYMVGLYTNSEDKGKLLGGKRPQCKVAV